MSRPVITVFGATGAQGGGLVRALLCGGAREFRVRAVTRRPGSDAARALWELGAELCAADLDDPASVDRAMQDAHGAFCAAWARGPQEGNAVLAGTLARAAVRARLRHVVWSRLETDRCAVAAEQCFTSRGVPLTRLATGFHWDSLPRLGTPPASTRHGPPGLPCGDTPIPGIAADDAGACAAALFRQADGAIGRCIGVVAEHLTWAHMVAAWCAALAASGAEPTRHAAPPCHDDATPARPQSAMWDVAATRRLHPGLLSFAQWLGANAARLARMHGIADAWH